MRALAVVLVLGMSATAAAQPVESPTIVTAPSGWLLPPAVLSGTVSADHAGGVGADARVGLGGVAEFGLATADPLAIESAGAHRIERVVRDDAPRELPYATATFRLGVAEDRLFRGQPAVALGFRKSFEHDTGPVTTRFAELTLVASKHVGAHAALHAGVAMWDASIEVDGRAPYALHDGDPADQVRPFGGVELRPWADTALLGELSWVPVRLGTERVELRPVTALAVRYAASARVQLTSGLRLAEDDPRLFAQIAVTTWSLSRWVARHGST